MRVLHITNAVGKMNAGGIGDVLTAFVKHQRNIVDYIEVWHPNHQNDSVEFAANTGLDLEQIHSFETIGSDKMGFSFEMMKSARLNKGKFDIVHQHGIWLPISLATLRLNSKKIKKVISPHGFLNENALNISSKKKKIVAALFENENLRTATCLHACSSFEANYFREYGLKQDIALIPNGIDDHFLNATGDPKSFKVKHNINNKKVLLFLSRIHPSKGLVLLLIVIESLKDIFNDWKLVIAGLDELNHESELRALVKELNLEHLVIFTGPVFGQDKVDAFDASDVFVLPTDTENFGIVVAQALARKKPVITTTEAPWKDLVDYNCGWWIAKNESNFKTILKEVINLPIGLLRFKGVNGFNLIKKEYLWSDLTDRTIQLYNFLLDRSLDKPEFIL